MLLLDRVLSNINLCGVELAFQGDALHSVIEGWQPFYNSQFENTDFQKVYASLSSIDFSEESTENKAGTSYKQKAVFRFPNSDPYRADRIALLMNAKFIKLKQTNGLDIVIGRNDINQNSKPKRTIKQNHQLAEFTFESSSIFASGYTPNFNVFGLPVFIPLNLITTP
jgi:hypothetical protein